MWIERTDPPLSSFLGLAAGRVGPRAGGRGLLMAPLKPLTLIQETMGSLHLFFSWGSISESGVCSSLRLMDVNEGGPEQGIYRRNCCYVGSARGQEDTVVPGE